MTKIKVVFDVIVAGGGGSGLAAAPRPISSRCAAGLVIVFGR